jgi:Galactose oxidase, central domain
MKSSHRWGLPLLTVLAVGAGEQRAFAQIRVLERARYQGLDELIYPSTVSYGRQFAYYDRARKKIVSQSASTAGYLESREWSGPGEIERSLIPYGRCTAVCPFPNRPGAGLGFVLNWGGGPFIYEDGEWTPLPGPSPASSFEGYGFEAQVRLGLDENRQRAVLTFRGYNFGSHLLTATWEFDGSTWIQASSAITQPWPPSPHRPGFLVYNRARQRIDSVSHEGEIESWDGSSWTQRRPPIPGFAVSGACFDSKRSRLVVLGHYQGGGLVVEHDPYYAPAWYWGSAGYPSEIQNAVYHEARRRIICTTQAYPGAPVQTSSYDGPNEIFATWSNLSGSTVRPPARNDAMLAVDDSRGAILFGGHDAGLVPNNETWLWDSATWTQLGSTVSPSARYSAAMADGRDSVVLFGGMNAAGQPLNDTWVFTASGWQQLNTLGSVPARRSHAMAANSADAAYSVYMFGGTDGLNWFSDLHKLAWSYFPSIGWRWIWHTMPTVGGPGGRDDHAMVVDVRRQKLVVFGGRNEFWQQFNDTWEFDLSAQTWAQRSPAQSPAPRMNPGMAYDRQRERVVLVGGYDLNTGASFSDIWEWDGTDWTQRIPQSATIAPTANTAMGYDHRTQRVVMFGGWNAGAPTDNTYELIEPMN